MEIKTHVFKRCTSGEEILKGMIAIHKKMEEEGLLTDKTTFEEMGEYAGRHVLITEMEK